MVPPQTTDFPPRKILCANDPARLCDWRLLWISNENARIFIPAPLPKLTRECWYLSLESSILPDLANHLLHSYCDVFVIEVQSKCISCNRSPIACIKNPVCGASLIALLPASEWQKPASSSARNLARTSFELSPEASVREHSHFLRSSARVLLVELLGLASDGGRIVLCSQADTTCSIPRKTDRPVWLVINILNVLFFAEWVYRDGHTCLCPLQAIRPACVDLFLLTPNKLSHSVCKVSLSVECNRQPLLQQRDLRPAVNLSDLLDAPFGLLQPRSTHGRGSSFARRKTRCQSFVPPLTPGHRAALTAPACLFARRRSCSS